MRKPVSLASVALTGTMALTFAAPAAAQEASPVPAMDAIVCDAEPRDIEELLGFYFSPDGTPLATPTTSTVDADTELPTGEPADAETEAAVSAVAAEVFACFGDEQYARAFALMTDDLARQFGPDVTNPGEDSPEEVRALLEEQLTATPSTEGIQAPMMTRDLRTLSEGRVGGIWELGGDAVFLVFEQQEGRWLLDEVIDILEPGDATPIP